VLPAATLVVIPVTASAVTATALSFTPRMTREQ